MTTQSLADTPTPEHVRRSLWQRLSPFLDVIGAVLIFGSWILSNTMTQRAADQAKTHQAIIDHVRHFRIYDDFAHRISDIQSDLVRTRNLVEHATRAGSKLDGQVAALPDALTWTGMTATQVRELKDFVRDLDRYAGQLSSPATITQSIETAKSGVKDLSKAFHTARDEFDQLVEQRKRSPAEYDIAAEKEGEALRIRVDHLWQNYDTAKQSMLHVGDDLLRTAAMESKSAGTLARQCKHLSYVLYVVGTLIILFGRAKSVLGTKKKRTDGGTNG